MKNLQSWYIGDLGEGGMVATLSYGPYTGYSWSISFGNEETYSVLEALIMNFPRGIR